MKAIRTRRTWRRPDLLTLRRPEEQQPTAGRDWKPAWFEGVEGEAYIVRGKGGLWWEIRVPHELAERLEARRLDAQDPPKPPRLVVDPDVRYCALYDIGGGNASSRSFADASKRALGWTTGAHGLRHGHAQDRLEYHLDESRDYTDRGKVGEPAARPLPHQGNVNISALTC